MNLPEEVSAEMMSIPYLPNVKIEVINGVSGSIRYKYSTVLRKKGEDGLYRDVIMKREYLHNPMSHSNTDNHVMYFVEKFIGEMYMHSLLFDVSHIPPSKYQYDEKERVKDILDMTGEDIQQKPLTPGDVVEYRNKE